MPQTPCQRANSGRQVKHTPGSAVIAGQVVIVGAILMIAPDAIAANVEGVLEFVDGWDVPKVTGAWSQGAPIYWAAAGNPIGGDVGSGAFTTVVAGNSHAGFAAKAAASADAKGKLVLTARSIAAPVAGVANGYKISRGVTTTVTASDTIVTGLTTVVSVVACPDSDLSVELMGVTADPGDQAGAPAAGSFLLKSWKPTLGGAAGNPTPIAATAFGRVINWIAIGT